MICDRQERGPNRILSMGPRCDATGYVMDWSAGSKIVQWQPPDDSYVA